MASEALYVSCKELHDPSFAPRIVLPYGDVSPGSEIGLLEATKALDTEVVSPSVNLSALAAVLPGPGVQLENVRVEQNDVFLKPRSPQLEAPNVQHVQLPMSSVVSETPLEAQFSPTSRTGNIAGSCSERSTPSLPSILVSPESIPQRQNVPTISVSHDVPSLPGIGLEHEAIACVPTMPPPTHEGPLPSDQDDDVQFILSVRRKRRRKRPRVDPVPDDQGNDATVEAGKDTPMHNSNDADQTTTLNTHTVGSSFPAVQSLSHRHSGMYNSQNTLSFPSTSSGSLLSTDPSSATSIPETAKGATSKRKRHQQSSLFATRQTAGNTNVNISTISAKMPILQRHVQPPQHLHRCSPTSTVQLLGETQFANYSKFLPHSGSCCLLNGPSPLGGQIRTNVVQPRLPILAGHVANTTPASLASMSESLRRRPSLYAVPQWQASLPRPGMAIQDVSANLPGSACHSPHGILNVNLRGIPAVAQHIAEAGNVPPIGITPSSHSAHPASQARNVQQPKLPPTEISNSQTGLSKQSHPPNMLVDIAQTCQDNFPFALIAKRHNQPIQKVFDTFSAVIQLPLLRSAVDVRRSGKLGSLRMKEFRAMKKDLKEMPKGEQAVRKRSRKTEGKVVDSA